MHKTYRSVLRSTLSSALLATMLGSMPMLAQSHKVTVENGVSNPVPVTVQNTPNVTVSGTPTVKVSGTVPVSGSVSATINGTPAVDAANLPLTNDGGAANAAVAVKGADEPARQAVSFFKGCISNGAQTCSTSFTVPAGKELVIEYVSVSCFGFGSPNPIYSTITTTAGGATPPYYISRGEATAFTNSFINSVPVKIYADPSTTVTLTGFQVGNGSNFQFSLSGHYVNVP